MENVKAGTALTLAVVQHDSRLKDFLGIAERTVALSAMGLFNVTYNLLATVRDNMYTAKNN